MKNKLILIVILLVVLSLFMTAFSPMQAGDPPTVVDFQDVLYQLVAAIIKVVIAVIGVYGTWLVKLLVDKLKTSIGNDQYNWLISQARIIVGGIAQNPAIAGPIAELTPEKLQAYAVDYIYELCAKYGVPFTKEQITAVVEDAVRDLKLYSKGEYSATKLLGMSPKG